MAEDKCWKDLIRRNHLGSVDMLGRESIQDEHITRIRETISRIYSLNYAKDDLGFCKTDCSK